MKNWIYSFFSLFFPKCCIVCEGRLTDGEERICTKCNTNLPRTNYHLMPDNPAEMNLAGKFPFVKGTSFFYYHKGSSFKKILYKLKYQGDRKLGDVMGKLVASELAPAGFFQGIDVLVPIPLHKKKFKQRGYNQSEEVAKGIALITGLPVDTTSIRRELYTDSQTKKKRYARWENVEGVFELNSPDDLIDKHVLLIDDVLTTGATLSACAECMEGVAGLRMSFLTLAVAK